MARRPELIRRRAEKSPTRLRSRQSVWPRTCNTSVHDEHERMGTSRRRRSTRALVRVCFTNERRPPPCGSRLPGRRPSQGIAGVQSIAPSPVLRAAHIAVTEGQRKLPVLQIPVDPVRWVLREGRPVQTGAPRNGQARHRMDPSRSTFRRANPTSTWKDVGGFTPCRRRLQPLRRIRHAPQREGRLPV